jgi:hypothetical protein
MKIIERYCGYKAAHYHSDHVLEIKMALDTGEIQGLVVRFSSEMPSDSIGWLADFRKLKVLGLAGFPANIDLCELKKLEQLDQILIDTQDLSPVIDFLCFPSLKSIACDWKKGIFRNTQLSRLNELRLWKYGCKDLEELKDFSSIERLFLAQSKCESLNGISGFKNISSLEICYMSKLSDISGLDVASLKELIIENSKKINDYSPIVQCANLEKLYIHHSAPIPSLDFVRSLKNLKSFRFIGTDVLDGNLEPLFSVSDVCFTQKKHFSHKLSDFMLEP